MRSCGGVTPLSLRAFISARCLQQNGSTVVTHSAEPAALPRHSQSLDRTQTRIRTLNTGHARYSQLDPAWYTKSLGVDGLGLIRRSGEDLLEG